MKFEELNDMLVLYFPNLKESIQSEIEMYEGDQPGEHVLYGSALMPYVKELLFDDNNSIELQRIFDFFEKLATSDDREVKNLLKVTMLEPLWDEKEIYEKSLKYMQPITKQINETIGGYLNIPKN